MNGPISRTNQKVNFIIDDKPYIYIRTGLANSDEGNREAPITHHLFLLVKVENSETV